MLLSSGNEFRQWAMLKEMTVDNKDTFQKDAYILCVVNNSQVSSFQSCS